MARAKKEEEPMKTDGWLATYGDMITLVLCFFVLLFAFSSIDVAKFNAFASSISSSAVMSILESGAADGLSELIGNGIMEMPMIKSNDTENDLEIKGDEADFQKMASDFETYFAENQMAERIELTVNDDSINLTFKDNVLFDSGSADIKDEALEPLTFIANELIRYPDMLIEIIGHTDNVPMRNSAVYPDNWHLSAGRAISVGSFFIDGMGLAPYNIVAVGRGEYVPIAPNDTDVNRARNRRVEIEIRQPSAPGMEVYGQE